jgi:hypothetical protein
MFNIRNTKFLRAIEDLKDARQQRASSEQTRIMLNKMHSRLRSFIGRKILWQATNGKWLPSVIANVLPIIEKGKIRLAIQLKSQWNGIWISEDRIEL